MATRKEQVSALSNLMLEGILTTEEFTRVLAALDGKTETIEKEKTPAQKAYEDYIRNTVANHFKSPASIKFPDFEASMVKQGVIKLDFKEQNVRYIETYIDAPNSYGTMLREPIIIGIDENFNPLFWAQHLQFGTLLGKQKGWATISK